MSRTLNINPVTRIEGHAKVHLSIDDSGKVTEAFLHVLEFRGFERFVQGMQVELMPTITSRICGTCPHAHHLVAAKCLDKVFSASPPRSAILLRELMNFASVIHSHAIHFFALAGPDLLLDDATPRAKRNLFGLLEAAPDLSKKALRLRSIGQRMVEEVGGRGTHPVTAVAGGMASGISKEGRERLKKLAAEGLELAETAVAEGKRALAQNRAVLTALPLTVHDLGTVSGERFDLYDGKLRLQRPDGSTDREFEADDYATHMVEESLPFSYGKQVVIKGGASDKIVYRVGPLARVNCARSLDTPRANEELSAFKQAFGAPCHQLVLAHHARLIELLHCAEKCVELVADDEIGSDVTRAKITGTPRSAVAHIEAPRGVLIHDYKVDANGIVQGANLVVATQHNIASINSTLASSVESLLDRSDDAVLDRVEFAIRCFDPCLSCSTHKIGHMPLEVSFHAAGRAVRALRR